MQSLTKMKNKTAYLGLLLAFALILSYVEAILPLQTGIPGMKLGLANLVVVLCLYLFHWREAFLLSIMKAVLSGFLFGSLSMIIYSVAGAILSAFVMIILKNTGWFHIPVVSAAGGVAHNLGQLLAAVFVVETYGVFYYMPVLIVTGLITGMIIGAVAALVLPHIQNMIRKGIS